MFFLPFWTFVILHVVSGQKYTPKEEAKFCFCNELGLSLTRDFYSVSITRSSSPRSPASDVHEQLLYLQVALLCSPLKPSVYLSAIWMLDFL